MTMKILPALCLLVAGSVLLAQAPEVENVSFIQRTDGSFLVDVYYDVYDPDDDTVDVVLEASDNYGQNYLLPCWSVTGDVGRGIPTGTNKHIVWDFYADNPNVSGEGFRVRIAAFDDLCGSVIKEDLTLTEDLDAISIGEPGAMLNIGAANITLDLGGHTIKCDKNKEMLTGVGIAPYDGITIKNGTIEGCLIGVDVANSKNIRIENLTIRNLDFWDFDTNVYGIAVGDCEDVFITNCTIEMPPVAHKEGIVNYHSYVIVDSVRFIGGAMGVNLCPGYAPTDNGIIRNSTFSGSSMAAILDLYSSGIYIHDNTIYDSETSIFCEPGYPGAVSGILMENNHIYDNVVGVYLTGAVESTIRNNNIHHNKIWGIALMPWGAGEGEEVYARDNIISNNKVVWNPVDLAHCDSCTGNTWTGNKFYTKDGFEIPDPSIAKARVRQGLSSVDSAAMTKAADAQLIWAGSSACDTSGESGHWTYIYTSGSQQKDFECWYFDHMVVPFDTVNIPWVISENNLPITGDWLDSDSVLSVANEMGGTAFTSEFDIENIEMNLHHSAGTQEHIWNVFYIAQDTILSVVFAE